MRNNFLILILGVPLTSCIGESDFGATTSNCDEICTVYNTAQQQINQEYQVFDRDYPDSEERRTHVKEENDGFKIESWFYEITDSTDTTYYDFSCFVKYEQKKNMRNVLCADIELDPAYQRTSWQHSHSGWKKAGERPGLRW